MRLLSAAVAIAFCCGAIAVCCAIAFCCCFVCFLLLCAFFLLCVFFLLLGCFLFLRLWCVCFCCCDCWQLLFEIFFVRVRKAQIVELPFKLLTWSSSLGYNVGSTSPAMCDWICDDCTLHDVKHTFCESKQSYNLRLSLFGW